MAETIQFSRVAQADQPIPAFLRVYELRGRPSDNLDPHATLIPVASIRRVTINDDYETVLYLEGDGGGRHSDVIRVDEPFEHFERILQAFDLAAMGYPEYGNRAPRRVTSKEIEIMQEAGREKAEEDL